VAIQKISYIVPCFNEEEVLPAFYSRVCTVAKAFPAYVFEFLFINDGSVDSTPGLLNSLAASDERVKVLHFARNHGHQVAITAGMDFSTGDVSVILDADLQDPPELIAEMINKVKEGYQIVHMQRRTRNSETVFKRFTAWGFYKLMMWLTDGNIIENSGDFKALTRPVLKTLRSFREKHRFLRGIFASLGYRQCIIPYDRSPRHAGKTKYTFGKMLGLALDAVLSFSSAPIKAISGLAVFSWLISFLYFIKGLVDHFYYKITVPGWTSIIILMTFFSGVIIFCLGLIASYVGRIYEQGQQRPLYWLSDARNVDVAGVNNIAREVQMSKDVHDHS
jgi:polyisoprenyl-phosphate glycosyltransferase